MSTEKEYFADFPKLTVLPWVIWAVVIGLSIGGVLYAGKAIAEPMMKFEQGGVRIVLHTEDCKLPEVSNLPKRATWEENGKVFEGCWGVQPSMRAVMMYFAADKSVAVAPASAFVRVHGA